MDENLQDDFLLNDKIQMDFKIIRWALKLAFLLDKPAFTAYTALFLFNALLPSVFLKLVSSIVDAISKNVEAGKDIWSIGAILIALVVVMFLNSFFGKIPNILWNRLHMKYSVGMQRKMCDFMKKVPVKYFDDSQTAKIMSLAQEGNEQQLGNFVVGCFYLLENAIGLIALLILAATTSYFLLIAAAVFLCITLPIAIKAAKRDWKGWVDNSDNFNLERYYQNLAFKADYAKEVRILGLREHILKRWLKPRKNILDIELENSKKTEISWSLLNISVNITKFLVLFVGLILLGKGRLTLGGLTVFVSVFESLENSCCNMGYQIMSTYRRSCDLKFKKLLFEQDFKQKTLTETENLPVTSAKETRGVPVIFECNSVIYSF